MKVESKSKVTKSIKETAGEEKVQEKVEFLIHLVNQKNIN